MARALRTVGRIDATAFSCFHLCAFGLDGHASILLKRTLRVRCVGVAASATWGYVGLPLTLLLCRSSRSLISGLTGECRSMFSTHFSIDLLKNTWPESPFWDRTDSRVGIHYDSLFFYDMSDLRCFGEHKSDLNESLIWSALVSTD